MTKVLKTIGGEECDLLKPLVEGDPEHFHFSGDVNDIVARSSTLLAISNVGMIVQTAYMSLETTNSKLWWLNYGLQGETFAPVVDKI